jgi:hypothetical protein
MTAITQVTPSPEARSLFNQLALRAEPTGEDENTLHITIGNTIVVSCQRAHQGLDAKATAEIGQLLDERWISPALDGGWLLV